MSHVSHRVRQTLTSSLNLREGLGTGTDRCEVLRAGETLVADEIIKESHDVATESSDLADSNEREDSSVTVGSTV